MVDPACRDGPPPRLLLPSSHADVRVTFHGERGFVLSLWHGQVCAASAPLSPAQAATVAGFVVDHLGAQATAADPTDDHEPEGEPTVRLAVVADERGPIEPGAARTP